MSHSFFGTLASLKVIKCSIDMRSRYLYGRAKQGQELSAKEKKLIAKSTAIVNAMEKALALMEEHAELVTENGL